MATLLVITGVALLIMETVVGMVANGSIVLINCMDWFRRRTLSPTDMILTCLGASRLMWQAVVILHITIFYFFLHAYILEEVYLIVMFMWLFADNLSLWLAACLSVWYLTKIATFSHPIFLQVKQRFPGLLPWLLLGSVVFSAFIAIIFFTGSINDLAICNPNKLFLNKSYDLEIKKPHFCIHLAISSIVPNVIPFVIFLASTILLIVSLWMHIRHLQQSGISTKDLNTSVHSTAIKALVSFAVLYLSSFVAVHLQAMLVWRSSASSGTSMLFHNVSGVYPPGHAVILILINPKLKQAWIKMIHHLKCHLNEEPP